MPVTAPNLKSKSRLLSLNLHWNILLVFPTAQSKPAVIGERARGPHRECGYLNVSDGRVGCYLIRLTLSDGLTVLLVFTTSACLHELTIEDYRYG
jgi:hypothetical protein